LFHKSQKQVRSYDTTWQERTTGINITGLQLACIKQYYLEQVHQREKNTTAAFKPIPKFRYAKSKTILSKSILCTGDKGVGDRAGCFHELWPSFVFCSMHHSVHFS